MTYLGRRLGRVLGAGAVLAAAAAVSHGAPEATLRLTLALDTLSADAAAALDRELRAAVESPGRSGARPRLRLSRPTAAAASRGSRPAAAPPSTSTPLPARPPARAPAPHPGPIGPGGVSPGGVGPGTPSSPPRATDLSRQLLQDAEPLLRRPPARATEALEGRNAPSPSERERVFVRPGAMPPGPAAALPGRRAGLREREAPEGSRPSNDSHAAESPPVGPHPGAPPPNGPRPPPPPGGLAPPLGRPPPVGAPPLAPPDRPPPLR